MAVAPTSEDQKKVAKKFWGGMGASKGHPRHSLSHIQKPHQMTRYLGGNLQKLRKFWVLGGNFVIF